MNTFYYVLTCRLHLLHNFMPYLKPCTSLERSFLPEYLDSFLEELRFKIICRPHHSLWKVPFIIYSGSSCNVTHRTDYSANHVQTAGTVSCMDLNPLSSLYIKGHVSGVHILEKLGHFGTDQ